VDEEMEEDDEDYQLLQNKSAFGCWVLGCKWLELNKDKGSKKVNTDTGYKVFSQNITC
jgi:hypothetical protein